MTTKQFNSENILISLLGHLILLSIIVTGATLVIDRAKLVTPDRIQIMEIDLSNVKISRADTKLYNVGTPSLDKEKNIQLKQTKSSAPIESAKPIEKPSLVDEEANKTEKQEKKNIDKKTDDKPAPKKKTVVRVNREVLSLDSTMTVSVVDALRVAMTRCWVIDTNRPDIADIRAVAHLTLRPNGTVRDVWFESGAREQTDPAFAYVLGTIRAAIDTCQPFKMLPRSEFNSWEKIQLTFYPTQGKVM